MKQKTIILEPLKIRFSVCQVSDYSGYILTKEENFEKALKVLKDAGYRRR